MDTFALGSLLSTMYFEILEESIPAVDAIGSQLTNEEFVHMDIG